MINQFHTLLLNRPAAPFTSQFGQRYTDQAYVPQGYTAEVARTRQLLIGSDNDLLMQNFMADKLYQLILSDQCGREVLASWDMRGTPGQDRSKFEFGNTTVVGMGPEPEISTPVEIGLYDGHLVEFETRTYYDGDGKYYAKISIDYPRKEDLYFTGQASLDEQSDRLPIPSLEMAVRVDSSVGAGIVWTETPSFVPQDSWVALALDVPLGEDQAGPGVEASASLYLDDMGVLRVRLDLVQPQVGSVFFSGVPGSGANVDALIVEELGVSITISGMRFSNVLWRSADAFEISGSWWQMVDSVTISTCRPSLTIPQIDKFLQSAGAYSAHYSVGSSQAAESAVQMLASPLLTRRVVGAALCCALVNTGGSNAQFI